MQGLKVPNSKSEHHSGLVKYLFVSLVSREVLEAQCDHIRVTRTGERELFPTHFLYCHRNLITNVSRISPGYVKDLKMQYSTISHSDLSHMNQISDLIHHFIVLQILFHLFFSYCYNLFLSQERIPFPTLQPMVEALNLALLIFSQVLNPVLVSPSSSMRQEGELDKEKVFRTNDCILFAQLSPNVLIFCPQKPDYTS